MIVGTPDLYRILPNKCLDKSEVIFDTVVDTDLFRCNRPREKSGTSIIFVGRLEPIKGAELLCESFFMISKEFPDLTLKFVGDGSLRNSLERMALQNKLQNRIRFYGQADNNSVVNLLNESDIFCLPTLREPGGGAILEAMACELPVVTTDYGGPAYSVTDEAGIKIRPVNWNQYINDLADSLRFLLKNEAARIQMGRAGRKRVVEEYSARALETKIIKAYAKITGACTL